MHRRREEAMARRPVRRPLPSLQQLFAEQPAFAPGENQRQRLVEVLRDAALRLRRERDIPFYAIRQVSAFFGLPYPSVRYAYRQLSAEGLLRLVRGSRTILTSNKLRPRPWLRGVAAVPVWTPGFVTFGDWRTFFRALEHELHRRHWIADMLFFNRNEELDQEFVGRVLDHHPNCVVWFCPHQSQRQTLAWLADAGLRIFTVLDRPGEFPGVPCKVRWDGALRDAFEDWQDSGIDRILIPQSPVLATSATHVAANNVCGGMGLACSVSKSPPDQSLRDYLASIPSDPQTGVFWDDDLWFDELCGRCPDATIETLQRTRSLVMRPLNLSDKDVTAVSVDALVMDWRAVATQLAAMIDQEDMTAAAEAPVIEADYRPRLSAKKIRAAL
jgi:hypothetical protein